LFGEGDRVEKAVWVAALCKATKSQQPAPITHPNQRTTGRQLPGWPAFGSDFPSVKSMALHLVAEYFMIRIELSEKRSSMWVIPVHIRMQLLCRLSERFLMSSAVAVRGTFSRDRQCNTLRGTSRITGPRMRGFWSLSR